MNMILYVDCIIIIIVIILHGTYVQCTLVQLCKQFWVFQNSRSTNSENNFHNVVFVLGSLSLSRYSRQTILPPEAMVQKQPCRWRRKKKTFFVTSTWLLHISQMFVKMYICWNLLNVCIFIWAFPTRDFSYICQSWTLFLINIPLITAQ